MIATTLTASEARANLDRLMRSHRGLQVPLVCIDDLIALKQSAGRPIDLADIEHLQRLQKP